MNDPQTRAIVRNILIALLPFLLVALTLQQHADTLEPIVKASGLFGMFVFVLMAILAVVFPIWSNLFLIPIGTMAWGPIPAALLLNLGWSIGSFIAFAIGRGARTWLLFHFPSFNNYQYVDKLLPQRHQLLALIFLRMTFPVDILSYALGLFGKSVSYRTNAITTMIGVAPFSFVFAYLGAMSMTLALVLFIGTFTALLFYIIFRTKNTS